VYEWNHPTQNSTQVFPNLQVHGNWLATVALHRLWMEKRKPKRAPFLLGLVFPS
jgi:hypothetical protein